MKKITYDRLTEMEIFLEVAHAKNFSDAARKLNLDPSSVSKMIAKIEKRLMVRLFNRTTRQIVLSEVGTLYYDQAKRFITEVNDFEETLHNKQQFSTGKVKITCSIPFAIHQLIRLIPAFNTLYPEIEIVLLCTDEVLDLVDKHCDLAIRSGQLKDSQLISRKLFNSKMILVASPNYLKNASDLKHPKDLKMHRCLNFYSYPQLNKWLFTKHPVFEPKSLFHADNGESVRIMALNDGGIARLSAYHVFEDIQQKRLIPLLINETKGYLPFYLLHLKDISARTKCVADYFFHHLVGQEFKL